MTSPFRPLSPDDIRVGLIFYWIEPPFIGSASGTHVPAQLYTRRIETFSASGKSVRVSYWQPAVSATGWSSSSGWSRVRTILRNPRHFVWDGGA